MTHFDLIKAKKEFNLVKSSTKPNDTHSIYKSCAISLNFFFKNSIQV